MNTKNKSSCLFRGIGIGNGCVGGKLKFLFRDRSVRIVKTEKADAETERQRIQHAVEKVKSRLSIFYQRVLGEAGEEDAQIFQIHQLLLEDEDFLSSIDEQIQKGVYADTAVELAGLQYAQILKNLEDPYLSERAADIRDISEQLIQALEAENELTSQENESYILVADDLSPSETVSMDKHLLLGIVIFGGTPNSHTAILARALGIPALVGVGRINEEQDGEFALLNAAEGSLLISPNAEQHREFLKQQAVQRDLAEAHTRYLRSLINQAAVTKSGRRMLIYANVGDVAEIPFALTNGAEGIGLLRSEFLYLSMQRYPTEEELMQNYCEIINQLCGKKVIIRTLDIGADKQAPYFEIPHEENPALGFRGIRLCLSREAMFKTQLRAILRASAYGSVSIMLPMVVSAREVQRCRNLLSECKFELAREQRAFDEKIELGVMIETPAAAIMCEELAYEADFFSVGTNDLLQYTLAADRQNPLVANICEENREAVLRLIAMSADAIHRKGGWIGICGELAANLQLTQRFVDMGVDELSVSAPYLLDVREKVTECR